MGFVWTISPAVGDTILAVDTQEIRDNTDWIADNLANFTYDDGHDSGLKTTHKHSNYPTDDATLKTGYDGAHCPTDNDTNLLEL